MTEIPILIISLPDSERLKIVVGQLDELDLDYAVIEGINGNNLSYSQLRELVDYKSCYARLGYTISNGLIGCYLGHARAYEKLCSMDFDWALILEEDVEISNLDFDAMNNFKVLTNTEPAIVQLFTRSSRLIDKNSIVEISSGYYGFAFLPRLVGSGTAAYLINKEAVALAIKSSVVTGAPDWPPWSQGVKFYGVYPWMFHEEAQGSAITNNQITPYGYRLRRIQQILGIHYLIYRRTYKGLTEYYNVEIRPYLLYLRWKISGSKTFDDKVNSPQIL